MKAFLGAGKSESKKSSDPSTRVGATAMTIPDSALPDLCRIVSSAGSDGINKVVNTFMAMQGNVSKRQIEIKINEIAVKEKRPEDYYIVWHLRDEYAKYLKMTGEQAAAAIASETANKKRKATDASPSADTSTKELASKSTTKGGAAEPKSASKDGGAQQKQKLDDGGPSSALKEPKRFKTAFGFFVKVMREKAEKQLGPNAEENALKNLLTDMWVNTNPQERKPYEKKEEEDRQRYDRELEAYEEARTAASAKKRKTA